MHLALISTLLITSLLVTGLSAQTPGQSKSVYLSATVQSEVPRIRINWPASGAASSYLVYRKAKSEVVWGNAFPTLPGTATGFADSTAEAGQAYEYRVIRTGSSTAYGYILSGFEVPAQHWNGDVLLVLDTTHLSTFSSELVQWKENRRLSNIRVHSLEISPTDPIQQIKSSIIEYKNLHPNITALFLLGRVPVPYSGNVVPDGHVPDHQGAWPADGYYAELDGNWTDVSVNITGATQARNHNIPGDGKFDQNAFPGNLELQVGRVDLSNLPALGNEGVLLKKYLQKDNSFYEGRIPVRERALIDDNFTGLSEGFTASAWQTFSSSVGVDSIATSDYFTTMRQGSHLWSYGCGPGSFTAASGVGNTNDYAIDSLENIFTMTFGSYFGDWDNSNNFLRAALGGGSVLANVWSGRPYWHFHHMALGESLGFSALQSMNNTSLYDINLFPRGIHMALHGDPTLKSHPLPVVNNVNASFANGYATITWDSLDLSGVGYFVYRRNADTDTFHLLNNEPIVLNRYEGECPDYNGVIEYMVRPVSLKTGNSGSYYALGTGRSDTLISNLTPLPDLEISTVVNENTVNFSAPNGATYYGWDFGDGTTADGQTISHTYPLENASYTVTLFLSNGCIEGSTEIELDILLSGIDADYDDNLLIFPNPASDILMISSSKSLQNAVYHIYDAMGRECLAGKWTGEGIDVSTLNSGAFSLLLQFSDGSLTRRRIIVVR